MTNTILQTKCFCGEKIPESLKESFQGACFGEVKYVYQAESYCIMHFPNEAKTDEFQKALEQKLIDKDFDFRGAWFPYVENFVNFKFEKGVDFFYSHFSNEAKFNSATFNDSANFHKAKFLGVDFDSAIFQKGANFSFVTVEAIASFRKTHFLEETDFSYSTFSGSSYFFNTIFSTVKFSLSTFSNDVGFAGSKFNSDADFHAVQFTSVNFRHSEFFMTANFRGSVFKGQTLFTDTILYENADFQHARFENYVSFSSICKLESIPNTKTKLMIPVVNVDFSYAQFDEVSFNFAQFQNVFFFRTKFIKEVDFWATKFTKFADFRGAVFYSRANFTRIILETATDVKFREAIFKDYLIFDNSHSLLSYDFSEASLNLQDAKIEKPEYCRFHSVSLRPHWFINTDTRKFEFANINWVNANGNPKSIKAELNSFQDEFVNSNPHKLLTITCRQLAHNAEENNRYEEASSFRQMALETERLERKEKRRSWLASFSHTFKKEINLSNIFSYSGTAIKNSWSLTKTFPSDVLHFLYRIFSGYGERWFRAFCWLIVIWLFWAFLYATPICDFIEKEKYGFSYWIGYSLNVITLQRPEPKPANTFTMIILSLEVLSAPLQAALLILAVRRKFMR